MIDLHCHILHSMDDGPETLRESVEMCRMATLDGTTTIAATPHFNPAQYPRTGELIRERINELDAALQLENIALTIVPGADVAIFPDLPTHPGLKNFLSINNSRYLLLEFPHFYVPQSWDTFLRSLLGTGTVPIITHPERNYWFVKHPKAVEQAVQIGALVQITAMSLLGGFGNDARKFSIHLLKRDLVHVIASDGHSATMRRPLLSEGVKAATALIGDERARELVETIPAAIVANRPVRIRQPRTLEEGKRGWFNSLARMMNR
ncbi:MAG: capsular biosynthesis protein [Nitrospirae bacterium]|nr:capsular biosynthesis protein [Nitrospirota bacterium]